MHLKAVHTALWPHYPNTNVFSNRMTAHILRLGDRLFQTCGPVAAKVLSPKLLHIWLTLSSF